MNKRGRTKLIYIPMALEWEVLLEYCSHARLLLRNPLVASPEEQGGGEVGESLRVSLTIFVVCNMANEDKTLYYFVMESQMRFRLLVIFMRANVNQTRNNLDVRWLVRIM